MNGLDAEGLAAMLDRTDPSLRFEPARRARRWAPSPRPRASAPPVDPAIAGRLLAWSPRPRPRRPSDAGPGPRPPRLRLVGLGAAAAGLLLSSGCANMQEYKNSRAEMEGYDAHHAAASPYKDFGPLAQPVVGRRPGVDARPAPPPTPPPGAPAEAP